MVLSLVLMMAMAVVLLELLVVSVLVVGGVVHAFLWWRWYFCSW